MLGDHMSSRPALETPVVTIRTATPDDHDALQALDGSAPDARANLIQTRRNFFARVAAYDHSRVLVAEQARRVVGVLCLALTPVRVAGRPCAAGYMFNIRVARGQQTRGVGTRLMRAGAEWLEGEGCRYATGLIGVSNDASMKMVGALGWEAVGRFDYLILDLSRFTADPAVRIRKVDALGDPAHAAWRFGEVSLHHFVPRYLVSELFQPAPKGAYVGSLTAFGPAGSAWMSLWDDRARRGLDLDQVRAVKAYDVTLKGEGGFRAFSAIAATLREAGLDHVLMPLPHDAGARALLEPYAGEIVEFNFVIKRLNGAGSLPPGPIYFDIRH
jgi:predicted N-acetyltransferase YhbS